MKKVLAIILTLITMITLSSCVVTDNNIENYAVDVENYNASLFMPNLEEIGEYTEINYFLRKDESIFSEYSIQLIVRYDEKTFIQEKERLKTAYTYLDEPQKLDGDNDFYTMPTEEFSYAGFDFRIAVFEDTFFPKNFGMVGISDEKHEIAYLWLYAQDLDFICYTNENEIKEMNEFVEHYFSLK